MVVLRELVEAVALSLPKLTQLQVLAEACVTGLDGEIT
jgi:hypothetical protein